MSLSKEDEPQSVSLQCEESEKIGQILQDDGNLSLLTTLSQETKEYNSDQEDLLMSQDNLLNPHQASLEKMIRGRDRENEESKLMTFVATPVNINPQLVCIFRTMLTISHLNRGWLNLPKHSEAIMKRYMPEADFKVGVNVDVFDSDKVRIFPMSMIFHGKRFVLGSGWLNELVLRRGLQEGEEIGLYWDDSTKRIHFTVHSRAPSSTP